MPMGYPTHRAVRQTFAAKVLRTTFDSDPSAQSFVFCCLAASCRLPRSGSRVRVSFPAPVSQFFAQPLKLLDREPERIADVFRMGVTIPQQPLRGDIHDVPDAVDQVDQLLRVRQRAE